MTSVQSSPVQPSHKNQNRQSLKNFSYSQDPLPLPRAATSHHITFYSISYIPLISLSPPPPHPSHLLGSQKHHPSHTTLYFLSNPPTHALSKIFSPRNSYRTIHNPLPQTNKPTFPHFPIPRDQSSISTSVSISLLPRPSPTTLRPPPNLSLSIPLSHTLKTNLNNETKKTKKKKKKTPTNHPSNPSSLK